MWIFWLFRYQIRNHSWTFILWTNTCKFSKFSDCKVWQDFINPNVILLFSQGCRVKDHLLQPPGSPTLRNDPDDNDEQEDKVSSVGRISSTPSAYETIERRASKSIVNDPTIVNDLLAHRDIICLPYQRLASARWELSLHKRADKPKTNLLKVGWSWRKTCQNWREIN